MSWPFIGVVGVLFGALLGQFGYGTGVLLILAAAILWGGGALQLWVNASDVYFLIASFSVTGGATIATHFLIVLARKFGKTGHSGESP